MTETERAARIEAAEEIWHARGLAALRDHDVHAAVAACYCYGSDLARILASA